MRRKTIGYIVTGGGKPMVLGSNKDDKDKLYFGNTVTIFWTRREANKAVDATWADRPTFEQEFGSLVVKRVEERS